MERQPEGESSLPEDLDAYFLKDPLAFDVDIAQLSPTRRRPDGVRNAALKMDAARRGEHPRRAPLTVRRNATGSFDIVDGNSTYAVALAQGWTMLRCRLEA